jgi:hypothetical protein
LPQEVTKKKTPWTTVDLDEQLIGHITQTWDNLSVFYQEATALSFDHEGVYGKIF